MRKSSGASVRYGAKMARKQAEEAKMKSWAVRSRRTTTQPLLNSPIAQKDIPSPEPARFGVCWSGALDRRWIIQWP
jgi:hypothetical protein